MLWNLHRCCDGKEQFWCGDRLPHHDLQSGYSNFLKRNINKNGLTLSEVRPALANLKYWSKHRTAPLANVATQSDTFGERLSEMKFREQASVRVLGLAIGIEFGEETHYASQLGERCRKAGLLVSAEEENLLTMFPPLTIEREAVREGLDILEGCL